MSTTGRRDTRFAVFAVVAVYLVVVLRTAWISDDAFITLRTVDNFVNGYGLRWNLVERVQSFTHPLWLFALSLPYYFTREPYYTTLALSIVLSVCAVAILLYGCGRSAANVIIGGTILIFSKAFVDYSTSGLENPLTYFLLSIALVLFFAPVPSDRKLLWLSLCAGLGMTNRMDTALLFLPLIAFVFFQRPGLKRAGIVLLGLTPFLAWELFSLIYYGFPFPNTAYAKIHVSDVETGEIFQQGFFYILNLLDRDPLTASALLVGIFLPFFIPDKRGFAISLAIMLYSLYVILIGGDFMSARFFAAPLMMAVALIVTVPLDRLPAYAPVPILIAIILLGWTGRSPTILSGSDYGYDFTALSAAVDSHGIADERGVYYGHTGLLRQNRTEGVPNSLWLATHGRRIRSFREGPIVESNIGFVGYYGSRDRYVIDGYGLSDPLIARLPPIRQVNWRIGHMPHVIPDGYLESVASGVNQLVDPQLAAYYDYLQLITRGELLDPQRWQAIVNMNLGRYDRLIDEEKYRYPEMVRLQ